jgi:hypothetical protein
MSDEIDVTQEIPVDDDNARAELTAIDRNGRDPLVAAPAFTAFSVLWWIEGEETSR